MKVRECYLFKQIGHRIELNNVSTRTQIFPLIPRFNYSKNARAAVKQFQIFVN